MSDVTIATNDGAVEISRPTATDLSTKIYLFVKHDASEEIVLAGAGNVAVGVLQNQPNGATVKDTAQVRIGGASLVLAGGAITSGAYIKSDGNGAGVVTAGAGENFNALALTSADSGDRFLAILCHGQVHA